MFSSFFDGVSNADIVGYAVTTKQGPLCLLPLPIQELLDILYKGISRHK